jgi:superoxide dismutase, Fe-Mn family
MSIILAPLPFAASALAPHISAQTVMLHHGKHQKSYVDKTNAAIEGGRLDSASLEEIIMAAEQDGDAELFNPAAQAWNHAFYWESIAPEKQAVPNPKLEAAIVSEFGGLVELRAEMAMMAEAHFGSGWVWLVMSEDKPALLETHDAGTPLTFGVKPLLTIDVWEHAYYLDQQNERHKYVKAVVEKLFNWSFANENFVRETAWAYPRA